MRRYRSPSALLVVVLAGCSLGPSYRPQSSAIPEGPQANGSGLRIRTLYNFGYHQSDGAQPKSALYETSECTQTCHEDLYGTTAAGGVNHAGTIFDVYTDDLTQGYYDETLVMNFSPAATGSDPTSPVIVAAHRSHKWLLATASHGGAHGKGTVVSPRGAGVTLSFNGQNGALPTSGLTLGPRQQHGWLFYTTTFKGGAHGKGTILAIRLSRDMLTSRVLYSFNGKGDGANPNSALNSSHFGTTFGSSNVPATVYEFNPGKSAAPAVIYTFTSSEDGADPTGVAVQSGGVPVLYGTTVTGGKSGYGTLYELKQTGSKYAKVTLHTFAGGSADGAYPQGALANYGNFSGFYGVTEKGGAHNCGTIFRLNLSSGDYAVVYSFTCGKDGAYPKAPLANGADGLTGTTSAGGAYHRGTVFTFKVP